MAFKLLNRARMSVSGTPGTGAITLNAAATGFQSFSAAGLSNGDTIHYVIEDGSNWEMGIGTYTSSGTSLARTTITESSAGGTTAISVTSAAIVTATLLAADIPNALASLTGDVAISSPAQGQLIVYESATGKWTNQAPPTVGFTVGTPPNIVQFNYATANGADTAVTMGVAPTNGNMLVAIIYSDNTTPVAASGWTLAASTSAGLWYQYILTKIAGASEPTSQNPISSGGGGHWTKGIWEVHGQNGTSPIVVAAAQQTTVTSTLAQTNVVPQSASTLYLASLCASQNQTYDLTNVFSIATVDANLTGAAGAKAAFGHSDSNNPTYGMLGQLSTAAQSNNAFILITA